MFAEKFWGLTIDTVEIFLYFLIDRVPYFVMTLLQGTYLVYKTNKNATYYTAFSYVVVKKNKVIPTLLIESLESSVHQVKK